MGFIDKHLCCLLLKDRLLKLHIFQEEHPHITPSSCSCADVSSGRDFLDMHLITINLLCYSVKL